MRRSKQILSKQTNKKDKDIEVLKIVLFRFTAPLPQLQPHFSLLYRGSFSFKASALTRTVTASTQVNGGGQQSSCAPLSFPGEGLALPGKLPPAGSESAPLEYNIGSPLKGQISLV